VSTHADVPDAHDVMPTWHGFGGLPGVQLVPEVHAAHWPPLHTWPAPHGVPSLTFVNPVHISAPVEHDVVPTWQTLPGGLHPMPGVQLMHCPLAQTWLVPHAVPSGAALPVSPQAKLGEHETVPRLQGLLAGTHAAPFMHEAHVPSSQ
jgi:hypothetical protein